MKYRIKGPGTLPILETGHLPLIRPQSGTLLVPESPGGMGLFLSYSYFAYPPRLATRIGHKFHLSGE